MTIEKIGVILQWLLNTIFFSLWKHWVSCEIQNYKSNFKSRINQILDWLGLKQIENTKVDKLSKGENKSCNKRALINKPEIIIADQPENFLTKVLWKKFFLFESWTNKAQQ